MNEALFFGAEQDETLSFFSFGFMRFHAQRRVSIAIQRMLFTGLLLSNPGVVATSATPRGKLLWARKHPRRAQLVYPEHRTMGLLAVSVAVLLQLPASSTATVIAALSCPGSTTP